MLTRDEIKDYFQLENSHAKKELGQNFLCNQKTIDEIVSLVDVQKDDVLLEIGPGLGALTNDLIGKTKNYTVVEYDAKFVDYLTRAYGDKDIKIVKNNILKYKEFDANKVVGNLPYYITSDILLYLALNYHKLDRAVLMMQREAYKRITAKQGTKDYNALNIVLDYCFKITTNMIVVKTSFFPMPQVDSVVLTFSKKNDADNTFIKPLLTCTRAMFLNRRKTIFNNLNSLVKNKDQTNEILKSLNFGPSMRAEELTLNDFINLTNVLLKLEIIKL
jgi:16S rRNA (adenine1518-N6/adenine1519-N6)-dimethyltransferase